MRMYNYICQSEVEYNKQCGEEVQSRVCRAASLHGRRVLACNNRKNWISNFYNKQVYKLIQIFLERVMAKEI